MESEQQGKTRKRVEEGRHAPHWVVVAIKLVVLMVERKRWVLREEVQHSAKEDCQLLCARLRHMALLARLGRLRCRRHLQLLHSARECPAQR